jgi:hypothetical protein
MTNPIVSVGFPIRRNKLLTLVATWAGDLKIALRHFLQERRESLPAVLAHYVDLVFVINHQVSPS